MSSSLVYGVASWRCSGRRCVNMCIRVVLSQTKNGLPCFFARPMKSSDAAMNSSSTVSMRLRVRGPVSVQRCLPMRPNRGSSVASSVVGGDALEDPAWPELRPECRILGVVLLLGIAPRCSGGRGCRRTRRSRAPSAGARCGRRGDSCRTGRSRIPAPSSTSASVGVAACRPSLPPGVPTVVIPLRIGYWPVMNAARPAVQDGWA